MQRVYDCAVDTDLLTGFRQAKVALQRIAHKTGVLHQNGVIQPKIDADLHPLFAGRVLANHVVDWVADEVE